MGAMAGRALGHFRKTETGYLAMIRGPVCSEVMMMAAAAGFHIVELELVPINPQGAVRIVTTYAGRGGVIAAGHGLAMDGLVIGTQGSCVTCAAGGVNFVAARR